MALALLWPGCIETLPALPTDAELVSIGEQSVAELDHVLGLIALVQAGSETGVSLLCSQVGAAAEACITSRQLVSSGRKAIQAATTAIAKYRDEDGSFDSALQSVREAAEVVRNMLSLLKQVQRGVV
jgi:hypothetical protein